MKLLQFHQDYRPPYWGTWSKTSREVTGRRPLGRDSKGLVNYDYDSEGACSCVLRDEGSWVTDLAIVERGSRAGEECMFLRREGGQEDRLTGEFCMMREVMTTIPVLGPKRCTEARGIGRFNFIKV